VAQQPIAPAQTISNTQSNEAIEQLMKLGFTREQASLALQQASGNADLAASILMGFL
jgi:Holliday junction resolvasome RuvABC DNA-binding subunit